MTFWGATKGLLIGTVVLELGFRLTGPLPSMRTVPLDFIPEGRPAVVGIEADTVGCTESDVAQPPPVAWKWATPSGDGTPLRLLVVGDSVTIGQGVQPMDTWAAGLALNMSEETGRRVEVMNAGVNASGYCGAFRMVHHQYAHAVFDKVVIGLFADDLEQRAVILEDGEVYANPNHVDGVVGVVASSSYAFNWMWLKVVESAIALTMEKGGAPPSYWVPSGRSVPAETLDNLARAIGAVRTYAPIYLLNPPSGQGLCSRPTPNSECDWMQKDMALMAEALVNSGELWVDNRTLFQGESTAFTLPEERSWFQETGRLPVHPNALGHERIARSVPSAWLRVTSLEVD